jgi:hypothetical protein
MGEKWRQTENSIHAHGWQGLSYILVGNGQVKASTVKPGTSPRCTVGSVSPWPTVSCENLHRISNNDFSPTGLSEGLGVVVYSETCLNLRIEQINVQDSPAFTISLAERT